MGVSQNGPDRILNESYDLLHSYGGVWASPFREKLLFREHGSLGFGTLSTSESFDSKSKPSRFESQTRG